VCIGLTLSSLSLRRAAVIGAIATMVGFFLVFLPIFQNPSLWNTPSITPAPGYVLLGFALYVIGLVVLLYSFFTFAWRNRGRQATRGMPFVVYKMASKPIIAGTIAFFLTGTATRLILPIPPEFGPQPLFSFGRLFWSIVVAASVSSNLIWYYDKTPTSNPILKSVILSIIALVIVDALEMLIHLDEALNFFLLFVSYEAATFVVAGLVVGFVHMRLYGDRSPFGTEAQRSP
jgi:hypothetical protein